jgi:hypothetical protein
MARFISLKCRKCKTSLEGENNSKIFFCTACHLAYDIDGDLQRVYQLSYIEPKIKKELPQVYFPFWTLFCEYTIKNMSEETEIREKRDFYVTAFFIKNINYFGDIGYYMSLNRVQLKTGIIKDIPIFPADRSFKHSAPFPLVYLYQDETRKKKKDTSLEIDIKHQKVAMALIPFYFQNHQYFDSILFWKYPSGALI